MKFPVFSLLTGNFGLPETSSLLTACASGESDANLFRQVVTLRSPRCSRTVGGSHDPLLEWALRESRCGLANLPQGSEEGLRRLTRGEVMAAAIHLHTLDSDEEQANLVAVAALAGLHAKTGGVGIVG